MGVRGEPGGRTEGFASDQKGASGADSQPDLSPQTQEGACPARAHSQMGQPHGARGPSGRQAEPLGTSDSDTEHMKTDPASLTVTQGTAGRCLQHEHQNDHSLENVLVTDCSKGNSVVFSDVQMGAHHLSIMENQLMITCSLYSFHSLEIFYDSLC